MSEKQAAATKRGDMVEALLAERANYVRAGKKDRVAAVDAQIKYYGGEVPVERRAPKSETA